EDVLIPTPQCYGFEPKAVGDRPAVYVCHGRRRRVECEDLRLSAFDELQVEGDVFADTARVADWLSAEVLKRNCPSAVGCAEPLEAVHWIEAANGLADP